MIMDFYGNRIEEGEGEVVYEGKTVGRKPTKEGLENRVVENSS